MTAVAAITIFYPPSDPDGFGQWVIKYLASARRSAGHLSARESIRPTAQWDWAVEVSFTNANFLEGRLDSAQRKSILSEGEADGRWRRSADLVLHRDQPPPAGVRWHRVPPGEEAEFIAAQSNLTRTGSALRGYEGAALFPADSSGRWLSVLRFHTPDQLTA
ncbi:hypothetical protein [Mycobacterium shigaense]|nr:hypothetical protein [Mycobacterium shigaense]